MSESGQDTTTDRRIAFGEVVYDGDGTELGRVRGLDEHGFYVSTADGVVAMSTEHEAGSRTGIKELHWRCWDCGELGRLEATALPEECPNCGAPKEELYYWQQDRAGSDGRGRGTDPGRTTGGAPVGTRGRSVRGG